MAEHDGNDDPPKEKLTLRQKLSRTWSRSKLTGNGGEAPIANSGKFGRRVSTGMIETSRAPTRMLPPVSFGTIQTYKKLEKLGEGTYATVYKGISHANGKIVALKEIRLEHEEGAPCTAIREVSLLKQLRHANIVTLHDIIHTKQSLTLVFEYLEKDLKQYMDDCGCFIEMSNVKLFLFQLLRGLSFCHSRKVLHRDLKPQNILINSVGELKLADFGLARAKSVPSKTYSNEVVTLWYRPPDVLLGSVEYSTSIDMWGVGCIFSEMISGRAFFPGTANDDQLLYIWKVLGTPNPDTWPEVANLPDYDPDEYPVCQRQDLASFVPRLERAGVDLLGQFLQYNPRNRISGAAAMKHRYFNTLGTDIHELPHTRSIFAVKEVVFKKDARLRAAGRKKMEKRRSSVRF